MGDGDFANLKQRLDELRLQLAAEAEAMADEADHLAAILEEAAGRGDEERRLTLAEVERRVAGIERRNAAKLRSSDKAPMDLESLPHMPQADTDGDA